MSAEERRRRALELKKALFALILQRTYLRNIAAQELAPMRDNPIRAYAVHPILAVPPGHSFTVEPLAFLLGVGGGELLNRLANAEAQYRSVVALIDARNEVHKKFQARLEAAQIAEPQVSGTIDDIRRIAGPAVSKTLERMTDDLYSFTDKAVGANGELCVGIAEAFRRLFPKEELFGVEDLQLPHGGAA